MYEKREGRRLQLRGSAVYGGGHVSGEGIRWMRGAERVCVGTECESEKEEESGAKLHHKQYLHSDSRWVSWCVWLAAE